MTARYRFTPRLRLAPCLVTLALSLPLLAAPARAEIAVLDNGMILKVVGQRTEGETLFLTLKGGGELGLPAASVRGLVPDEVLDEVKATADGGPLEALAAEAARRHGLDPELVLAVVAVESAFQPTAVSRKGAQGLMQLMPATARSLGVRDAFDPAANLDGGARYLSALIAHYGGDLRRALAAYNAGAGAVARHKGVPPYKETRQYVKKVLGRYEKATRLQEGTQ
jgi:soluble lytic murein transglycosylase-like protein